MKKKIIHRIPVSKSWFIVAGSKSIHYCGRQMYDWDITITPTKWKRLNIVYKMESPIQKRGKDD